jgi:PAS domain S-box-containing protein
MTSAAGWLVSLGSLRGGSLLHHLTSLVSLALSPRLLAWPLSWHEIWALVGAIALVIAAVLAFYAWYVFRFQARLQTLNEQVAQRNEALRLANEQLRQEVLQRQRAEEALALRSKEALRALEARFQAIFDHAAAGIVMLDLDRTVLDANPALCGMLGLSRAALLGRSFGLYAYADDQAEAARLFGELVAGQRDSYQTERRYVRSSGGVFWAHVTMSVVRGADGQPGFFVALLVDIDEQRQIQQQLRDSEARFRAMFDHSAVGMALLTLDRRVVQANQSAVRLTGYSADELKNITASDLALPEDRALGQAAFRDLLEGRRDDFQVERRYMRKDGRVFWARVAYSAVPALDGQPEYLVGMIEDIDEQRAARQRLADQEREYRRQLEEHVQDRTRELSEANTRLQLEMAQRQQAEAALAHKAADEAVSAERTRLARDLHDAVTQTLFSASLIAEVLPELWQIDAREARHSTDELRELTRGALAEMRTLLLELRPAALAQARFADLLKQLAEALVGRTRLPIELCLDGQRDLPPEVQVALYRIAQESLNNVIKHARASQVAIRLNLAPAGACLEITDDGVGFDAAATRPDSLGLGIMRERAAAIGAELHVDSLPGQGTRVNVLWTEYEGGG